MAKYLERTYLFIKVRPLSVFFILVFLSFIGPLLLFPFLSLIKTVSANKEVISLILSGQVTSSVQFGLLQASLSTLLSGIIGVSLAFFLLESGRGTRSLFWRLGLLSFSLPSLVLVLSLLSFWGKEGLGFSLFGWKGILLCHVMMNYPLFMKMSGEAWLANGTEVEMAALSLGATRFQSFFFVTLQKIRPAIFSASLLCFTYCFCSFIPVAILGGDPRLSTFELNIYQALKFENDYSKAALLALLQMVFLFPLFLLFKNNAKNNVPIDTAQRVKIYLLSKQLKSSLAVLFIILLIFLTYAPLTVLLVHAFKESVRMDAEELLLAMKSSFLLAFSCLLIVLPVSLSGVYLDRHHPKISSFFSSLLLLPLFIPVMLLSASLTNSFPWALDFLRESHWAVALIQGIVALPLVSRVLKDGYKTISTDLERAAFSLGSSRIQLFINVEIPLLKRFIFLSGSIAVCFSLGEVGTQLLFGSTLSPTVSLLIFQKLGKYALAEAQVYGGILMVLMALVLWGTEKCKPC